MWARLTRTSLKTLKHSNIFHKIQPLLLEGRSDDLCRCVVRASSSSTRLPEDVTIPDIKIQDVEHGFSERVLKVIWNDGSASRFPYVFLRENCKCSQCFHPSSSQRLVDTVRDIELNLNKVKEAAISESGDHLKCVWPDGHKSIYTTSWLLGRRMPEESERNSKSETAGIVKNEIILWDNELMQDKIPSFEYEAIMNDDKSLFNYLYALYQYGLVLVENAPAQSGVLLEVASRLGYHKPTHYGNIFDVKEKKDANDLAYTIGKLPFHADQLNMSTPPDIQMLHCIEQNASSGVNHFADGFNVAKQLKKINSQAFEILCHCDVPWIAKGTDFFGDFVTGHFHRTVMLNRSGRLQKIMFSDKNRMDSFRGATPDEVVKFYDAYYEFSHMMSQSKNAVEHHLKPGQIVQFHNTRVLHARTAVIPKSDSPPRWLQGIYFEWDVIFSKLRVTRERLKLKTPHLHEQSDDFF